MKFVTGLMCGVIGITMASALDIITTDGTVYRSVKLKMAGDEEVKVFHAEGENTIKLDVIRPFDLKTADGRVIQGVLLNGIRKNSIVVEQDGAVRNLRADQLSAEICGVFGLGSVRQENKKNPAPATQTISDKSLNLAKNVSESTPVEQPVKPALPANQMSAAGKIFLEKLKKAPVSSASPEYGITSGNIHKSVVFIRGGGGSGSGFICNLRGIPVIITNAHVYAALPNPTIMDSDRREYQVKSALACKTRDLVILEIELPAGVIPFEIEPQITNLALNSGLAAYGDSLGDGVVTDLKGILQGIGPSVIEISAGIVPGNSGGPVVGEKLRVIGVSTFLKRTSLSQNIFDGTRFGKKDAKEEGVRRFATRVDNMELNDFEIIDPEQKQKDLDAIHTLQSANNSLIQNIRGYKNSFEALMFYMKTYVPLDNVWNYRCSVHFLDEMFKSEIEKARFISVMLGMPMNNASAAERAQAQNLFESMQSSRKSEITCPRCHGAGIIRINDSRNLMAETEKRTCEVCQGNPKRSFIIYNLYSAFLSGRFKSSTLDFSGLFPGCSDQTAEAVLKSLGFPYKMDYCGAVSVWQYMGNNIYPEAKSTHLFFVASRLESVTITFDNSPAIWKRLQEQISAKYGKFDWDINHGSWRDCGIRQKGFSIDMRNAEMGMQRIVIICQQDMLSYLKYLVLNDIGRNIIAAQE